MTQSNNQIAETPKLKIATVVTRSEFVEKEIDLPYFFTDKDNYYKLTETHGWCVDPSDTWCRIVKVKTPVYNEEAAKGIPCTEEEFNEAYNKALSHIQNQNL